MQLDVPQNVLTILSYFSDLHLFSDLNDINIWCLHPTRITTLKSIHLFLCESQLIICLVSEF